MVYSKRFERKYIIDFDTYSKIVKEIKPFMDFDDHGNSEGKYVVSSVYYDSPDLRFYREKIDGEKNRVKIRIRKYRELFSEEESKEVHLELKKRNNINVLKKKARLTEKEAKQLLETSNLKESVLKYQDKDGKLALAESSYLKVLYDLNPVVLVSYMRQAFLSTFGSRIRITFDFNLKYSDCNFKYDSLIGKNYILPPNLVIMEIKYTSLLPLWVSNLVQKYNLFLSTYSKYCSAMELILDKREAFINLSQRRKS